MKTPPRGRFSIGHPFVFLASTCLLLSWLVPLHFLPWMSWHSELLAFFAVFLLAGCGIFLAIKKNRAGLVPLPVTIVPFGILVGVALIQVISGHLTFTGNALVIGLYAALCVMSIVLGYAAVSPYGASHKVPPGNPESSFLQSVFGTVATVVLIGSFASAIVSLVQTLDAWSVSWIVQMPTLRRPGGNLGQPNHLATLLLMGMVSLVFLYEVGRLRGISATLIFLILSFGVAASESRTGILSFLVLAAWWFLKRPQVNFNLSPWIVGLAGLGFLALFWLWPQFIETTYVTNSSVGVNTKAGTRLVVWPQLMEAVSLRPWWGWGLGEIAEAHNTVVHAYATSEPFTYSHNLILDLMLGMGVPLTLLLLLVGCIWLWRRVKGTQNLLSWYCFAVALPVAVHSMLEFPFAYAYFLVPVMFMLGALERVQDNNPVFQLGIKPAVVLVLALSVIGAWTAVEYVVIEEDFRYARFEAMHVGRTPPDYQRPNIVLLTQLDALLIGARISPRPNMTSVELDLAKNVALRYPWTATQNRYALSLALNGNPEEALRQLRVMRALHGEDAYHKIKLYWREWAQNKYPQLQELTLP